MAGLNEAEDAAACAANYAEEGAGKWLDDQKKLIEDLTKQQGGCLPL